MKVIAIIQARMSSKRLPGKVLMDLEGKLLLEWTIERLTKNVSKIPVAVINNNPICLINLFSFTMFKF